MLSGMGIHIILLSGMGNLMSINKKKLYRWPLHNHATKLIQSVCAAEKVHTF